MSIQVDKRVYKCADCGRVWCEKCVRVRNVTEMMAHHIYVSNNTCKTKEDRK